MKLEISLEDVHQAASLCAIAIASEHSSPSLAFAVFGIPRGGHVPASLVVEKLIKLGRAAVLVSDPSQAVVFVDDLVDSGSTRTLWCKRFPGVPFYALYNKQTERHLVGRWLVFPWEASTGQDESIVSTIRNRLQQAGAPFEARDSIYGHISAEELVTLEEEVANRCESLLQGLLIDTTSDSSRGTAKRMAKLFLRETLAGRYVAPPELTAFDNRGGDELYVTGPIEVRSTCAHHMCPILGEAWIGVLPNKRLLGLSKFHRVVNHFATRGQMQEELTTQIADYLDLHIEPRGLAVVIRALHTCAHWRGVKSSAGSRMTTSVVRGIMRENVAARAEFFQLAKI